MRDYKPYVAIAITALLASFTFSACTPITTIDQAADSAGKGDSTSTEASDHPNTITPAFFSEMGYDDVKVGGIIELVYIVLQSVVKPGITGFFKIDLHIKCYIYLS